MQSTKSGKWYLVVDDWDAYASNHGELVETKHEIVVPSGKPGEKALVKVAQFVFSRLPRYTACEDKDGWPKRPRLIYEVML